MDIENKITGPGYYPRRPTPRVGCFEGLAHNVRVLQYSPSGLFGWDSTPWRGRGKYSTENITSEVRIGGFEVHDAGGVTLYRHVLPSPQLLKLGERFVFDLDNPTPSREAANASHRHWIVTV